MSNCYEITEKAIAVNGLDYQLSITQEELAELSQAISKYKRKVPGWENQVLEEYADVYITLAYVEKLLFQTVPDWVQKFNEIKQAKLARLSESLDAGNNPALDKRDFLRTLETFKVCDITECESCILNKVNMPCYKQYRDFCDRIYRAVDKMSESEFDKYVNGK